MREVEIGFVDGLMGWTLPIERLPEVQAVEGRIFTICPTSRPEVLVVSENPEVRAELCERLRLHEQERVAALMWISEQWFVEAAAEELRRLPAVREVVVGAPTPGDVVTRVAAICAAEDVAGLVTVAGGCFARAHDAGRAQHSRRRARRIADHRRSNREWQ